MSRLPNPECALCGNTLSWHRLTKSARVFCLRISSMVDDAPDFKGRIEEESFAMTCDLNLLVESPLTRSEEAVQWTRVIHGAKAKIPLEKLPAT